MYTVPLTVNKYFICVPLFFKVLFCFLIRETRKSSLSPEKAQRIYRPTLVMTLCAEDPLCQKGRRDQKEGITAECCPFSKTVSHWKWICLHFFSVLMMSQPCVKPLHISEDLQAKRYITNFRAAAVFSWLFTPMVFWEQVKLVLALKIRKLMSLVLQQCCNKSVVNKREEWVFHTS